MSFRGAKRRGNLLQPVTFSPRPTCYPTWYCEIATSAVGRLAMTKLTASRHKINAANNWRPAWRSQPAIGFHVLSPPCRRNRNCLHEIATSASGLLAMTNLWPSLFYRQPVRIGSNAPGPAQHKRFVPATVKMKKAIDLSLRGRFAPVAISGRHLQSVQATVKTVCTNCVCSGAQ